MKASFLTFVCFLQYCVVVHSNFMSHLEKRGLHHKLFICINSTSDFGNIGQDFQLAAENLGYKFEVIEKDCDLNTTLKSYSYTSQTVIVNFNVPNFGHVDKHILKLLNDLTEDMVTDQYGEIDKSLSKCEGNHTDVYKRRCKDQAFNKYTKLFIGSLEKHQALYNVFNTITDKETYYKKEIVVCLESYENCPKEDFFNICCKNCNHEFECSTDTIAIVASSPESIKRTCDESIPAIFYDTLYIEPDSGTANFKSDVIDYNWSTTVMHWKDLSSTLDGFLMRYKWIRFAIISDDHPLSNKLKNDQIEHFKRRHILFASRDCCDVDPCDFREALSLYKEAGTKVIIVNVAKQNLNKFIESAKAADMTDKDILWIFPGYRNGDIEGFKYKLFVYLPKSISNAIELIKREYTNVLGNGILFREAIKNHQPEPYVDKYELNHAFIPSIGLPECALKTDNFFSPCDDWNVLYIIIVIIIFLLLVFVILIFFNQIQMNTLAYKPLHKPPPLWRQLLRREKPQQPRQGFQMSCSRRF